MVVNNLYNPSSACDTPLVVDKPFARRQQMVARTQQISRRSNARSTGMAMAASSMKLTKKTRDSARGLTLGTFLFVNRK